nr:unnamed protein product [Digitaria exilis]
MSSSIVSSHQGLTGPPPPAARDWAALPSDILLDVFLRLGPREVMLGAEQACKPWLRVAVEEPMLWRRVGLDEKDYSDKRRWRRSIYDVEEDMRLASVDRSKGQCEAFDGSCNDYDLLDLMRRAPYLKSLSIEHYYDEESHSIKHLVKPLKKLTLLEDLQIRFTYGSLQDENKLRSVCKA